MHECCTLKSSCARFKLNLPAAFKYFFLLLALAVVGAAAAQPEKKLIQAAGSPDIYVVVNGSRHHVEHPSWFHQNGYDGVPIQILSPAEMAAIPESYGLPQGAGMPTAGGTSREGMLIKDRDDSLYIVIKGVRHLLVSPQLIEQSRSTHAPPVRLTDSELRTLPLGADFTYISRGQKFVFVILFGFLMACLISLPKWPAASPHGPSQPFSL